MTSNQLQYWKLKEDERANREREAENVRSHKADEQLKGIQNSLRDKEIETSKLLKELDIEQRKQEDVLKLGQLLSEYGYLDWSQIPYEARISFYNYLGVDEPPNENEDSTSPRVFKEIWDFIKETAQSVGNVMKGAGALF